MIQIQIYNVIFTSASIIHKPALKKFKYTFIGNRKIFKTKNFNSLYFLYKGFATKDRYYISLTFLV